MRGGDGSCGCGGGNWRRGISRLWWWWGPSWLVGRSFSKSEFAILDRGRARHAVPLRRHDFSASFGLPSSVAATAMAHRSAPLRKQPRPLDFSSHAAYYVVHCDVADRMFGAVYYCQAAQVVFVEKFEDIFVVGVGGDGEERLEGQLGHALIGIGEERARDGYGAGERGFFVDEDYVVELVGGEFVEADVVHDFAAGGFFADDDDFCGHHAAGGVLFEFEEGFDVVGFAIIHFLEDIVFGFGLEAGEDVGCGVGAHFFDDVRGALGVQFFDDLGLEALVEFGDGFGGGQFVEGADDALALVGGEFFHDVG